MAPIVLSGLLPGLAGQRSLALFAPAHTVIVMEFEVDKMMADTFRNTIGEFTWGAIRAREMRSRFGEGATVIGTLRFGDGPEVKFATITWDRSADMFRVRTHTVLADGTHGNLVTVNDVSRDRLGWVLRQLDVMTPERRALIRAELARRAA